ncbi:MAG: hypothetical protein R3182_00390 [Draconibacterium sp.]|nr:hypothetical protein [Draconibacterium sp.]
MGYMGLGMQRWISTMKPRKFLGKRSKPDGGGGESKIGVDINEYYHLEENKLENLRKKKYSSSYKSKLNKELSRENRKRIIFLVLSCILIIVIFFFLFSYLNQKLDWF